MPVAEQELEKPNTSVSDTPATQDHSACGVGFIADEKGVPSNRILRLALEAASNMSHRGGVAADVEVNGDVRATTDGTGICIQVDQDYWKQRFARRFAANRLIYKGEYTEQGKRDLAVGTVFLPRDNDDNFEECRRIFKQAFKDEGYEVRERETRMDEDVLGELAKETHPRIYQYAVLQKDGVTNEKFDADLYRIRRKIEKTVKEQGFSGQGQNRFYISSLSRHIMNLKGLGLPHRLEDLFTDLKYSKNLVKHDKNGQVIADRNYKTSFAVIHDRYATNTAPTWERAHPYHSGVAHNGEINSLVTNVEMFKQRLEGVFKALYGDQSHTIMKGVISEDGTDSAQFADVVDFLKHAGLSPAAIKCLLVPEAVMPGFEMSEDVRNMYQFIDVLAGPWDGPSTVVMVGNNEILIGGDRSGFRPIRIMRTKDGIICGASEDGILHDIPNKDIIERPRIDPGNMLAVNFKEGGVLRDKELKERAAKELEEKFGVKELLKNTVKLDDVPAGEKDYRFSSPDNQKELLLRQRMGVFSQETIDYLDSMASTGKEPLGSMGDDAALAVTSKVYRTIQNFFQQKFAQVTNPPLDTIREKIVTSLKTHLGFFFGQNGKKTNDKVFTLQSPIVTNANLKAMRETIGEARVVEINCRFDASGEEGQLEFALRRVCREAQAAAESAAERGASFHIVLTDEHADQNNAPIPMVLAVGAVNTHLARLGLRGRVSLNARSAEAHEGHDFASLIGLAGADTVNAYMAEETIAARHKLGIYHFEDETSAYHSGTTLREFLDLYADTGDTELDDTKKLILERIGTIESVKKLIAEHGNSTLEDLAKHKTQDVRSRFGLMMQGLDVSVKDVFGEQSLDHSINNWKSAAQNGLLKIMGKMGISHIASYRGGRLFEAMGVSQEVIDKCFPGVPTPVKGLGFQQIQDRALKHHREVYSTDPEAPLQHKGRYKFRTGSQVEAHIMTAEMVDDFQRAVEQDNFEDGYEIYKEYAKTLKARKDEFRFGATDWMDFKRAEKKLDINEVESRESIISRFFTGSMSRGSISKEAHETLAIAGARKGFTSSSGEGGEDSNRYDNERNSKSKQVASARFGVDLDYLLSAEELQIKLAQGAKPGEGGELPGSKVDNDIAALRRCEPGTTLISPSTHHDIYSIEDLEQLTYDLKEANPRARVNDKLVSTTGVDVIASGCAKANADTVHIAGYNGGTGASPQGSIAHAGMPWEVYLNKVHRTLVEQGFRERVRLSADGGIRSGRDVVIAALLGAEEFGYGLQALIAEGCNLVRTCQNGKCPRKIAGNLGEFVGTPEMVMNMMDFIAEDVREILAELGLKSLDEAIGRTDLLQQVWGKELGLDLSNVISPESKNVKCEREAEKRNERVDLKYPGKITLSQQLLNEHETAMMDAIRGGQQFQTGVVEINNEDRTFGTRIAAELRTNIIEEFGRAARLKEDTVVLNMKGVSGQSLGFAMMEGMTINLEGAANDGVGKSLSGGKIIVRPDQESPISQNPQNNQIIGNAVLYGATAGTLYAAGQAGSRFAIRNSGATAVVEGAGYAACNYMTRGTAVILGEVGGNFGSGMSGGEAFVYDENNTLTSRTNDIETRKKITTIQDQETSDRLKSIVTDHFNATGSVHARALLEDWDNAVTKFKYINGKDKKQAPPPAFIPADELRNAA